MKKWFTNNMGIKLLSIMLAFLLWLVIINIDDPFKTKSFVVNVEVVNEDAIEAVNKVYEIVEGSTAQVTVKGNRSVVDGLKASDIIATADLSALSNVNAVAIKPHLNKMVSSEVELSCDQVLKVKLEDLETVQVKVTVETQGIPEDGYSVGECTAKPNMIEISGGKSVINKIDAVKVFLNVENISSEIKERLVPHVYDVAGTEIDSSRLNFSTERIRVTAQVLEKKSVPVRLKVTGTPREGYIYAGVDCLPETVEIAASPEILNKIDTIEIPVNIEGMTSDSPELEQDVDAIDYLPEGITPDQVKIVEDSQTISIRINLEPAVERTLTLTAGNIHAENLPENYQLSYLSGITYNIELIGTEEKVMTLSPADLGAYIECEGLEEGKHKLPVHFTLPEVVELKKNIIVTVRLVKKEETGNNMPDTTPEPDETAAPEPGASPSPQPRGSEETREGGNGEETSD